MKNTKKFASIATAALLAACAVVPTVSGVTASAAGITFTQSTTSNDVATHTYEGYQIFTGTVAKSAGNGNAAEITGTQWATGVKATDLLAALKADTTLGSLFTDCTTAASVAAVIKDFDADKTDALAALLTANKASLTKIEDLTTVADGYYLIIDTTTEFDNTAEKQGAISKHMLAVVDGETGLEITLKSSLPTVVKKVKEDDKYKEDGGYGEGYDDVADWCIGDAVPFKLIGTMPETLDDYNTYKYIFHDTLGSEFTAPAKENVTVKIDGTATDKAIVTIEGQEITVAFEDIKAAGATKTSEITVEYTAELNEKAKIGQPGQENKVNLEYSNNPNAGGEGDTGTTPDDKVIVFTYELDTTKVDGADNTLKLKDAEFVLQDKTGGSHNDQYVLVGADGKVTGWTADLEEAKASPLKSDENGLFQVIGLDDGAYNLIETKQPDGYNLATDPFAVTLTATTKNDQEWGGDAASALTALAVKVGETDGTVDENKGKGQITIENNSGSTLPSTGGIGTTIFYTVGGALVVGAGVLLITKKRAAKDAE